MRWNVNELWIDIIMEESPFDYYQPICFTIYSSLKLKSTYHEEIQKETRLPTIHF